MRFLFYSHDGLGLGHTRRHCAVAAALIDVAPNASILLATGTDEVNRLGLPANVEVLKMPSLRKVSNGEYAARRMGLPAGDIRAIRSELLLGAVKTFKPAVVLVDKHPLGAGREFEAGMKQLHRQGGRAVLGLRDILDDPATVLQEWTEHGIQKKIETYYDLVLLYGDRQVFDAVAKYQFSKTVAERTRACGYVVNQDEKETWRNGANELSLARKDRPLVLATTGGGEDGFFLLETFIRAAKGAAWKGAVIAGPMTPEYELKTLERLAADAKVKVRMFVPTLSGLFWSIDALVCMGGYNTLAEAVSQGVPTVCVPRIAPRREQLIRAQAFEQLGLLKVIPPEQLNVERLREAVHAALKQSRQELLDRSQKSADFEGARQAAGHLLALATERRPSRGRGRKLIQPS